MSTAAPGPNSFPLVPSPLYTARLGYDHLVHGALRGAQTDVLQVMHETELPADLRPPFDTWHMPGHLGEIPKTALLLERDMAAPTERRVVATVRRGAVFMTMLGVNEAVVGEYRANRTVENSAQFFDAATAAFMTGEPQAPAEDGPRQQQAAFNFAAGVGRWLGLSDHTKRRLEEPLAGVKKAWIDLLEESTDPNRRPDPDRLLEIAKNLGAQCTAAGAVLAVNHTGNRELERLGEIGGIEQAASDPFGSRRRGLHDFVTASVLHAPDGMAGLRDADRLRKGAENTSYRFGYAGLQNRHERRVFRTVAWFAMAAGHVQRVKGGLEGVSRSETAYQLKKAVHTQPGRGHAS